MCQKFEAEPPYKPLTTGTYCCELEVPGFFIENDMNDPDKWHKIVDECFAKSDDHNNDGYSPLVNGYFMYSKESVLCIIKTINQ